jgi:hypothetical protein
MTESGSAELAELLSHLRAHGHASTSRPPSPTEAMAMYFVAARLVELQLELVDRGEFDQDELAVTREVLQGTHQMLNAALDRAEESVPARPRLKVVSGDRPARRRPRGRLSQG